MRRVAVRGNEHFGDRTIVAGLAHRPPRGLPLLREHTRFDPFALRVDVRRIEAFYRERGYYSTRADAAVSGASDRRVDVRFEVAEGPATRLVAFEVRGVPADCERDVAALVRRSGLATGARFSHVRYRELKQAIAAALVERGYARAAVRGEVEVDVPRARAAARIAVAPGPPSRFGEVTVVGNRVVPDDVIFARVAWRRGDRFDPRRLQLTERRLAELGVFGAVRAAYEREAAGEIVDVEIQVTEARRRTVKLGGGFGADNARYEVRARAGYAVRSWLQPLVNLRLDGQVGYAVVPGSDQGRAVIGEGEASIERRDLLVPRLRAALVGWVEKDVFEAYTTFGPSVRIGLDRPFGAEDRLQIGIGWQLRALDIQADDPRIETGLGLSGDYRISFLEQSVTYDTRDDRFVPRRGWLLGVQLEQGVAMIGATHRYVRVTPDARLYLPLRSVVLATRARIGWLQARAGAPTPLTQRYFAGGSTSHRGFGYRKLAPTAIDLGGARLPVGGDALLESSVEARFPLPWSSLRGVVFVDGGDATESFGQLDLTLLHWAAGVGLRRDTAVGPARLDFAVRLSRTETISADRLNPPAGAFAIHFSLGEAF